jgi:4-amino-4-deoxy-L-arabinose transferase-like glycosyltransferase
MKGFPPRVMQVSRKVRGACVGALLCLLALQLVNVAHKTSSSWDEAHHLFDGYTVWKFGDYRLNPEVPPFIKMTAAVPLLHMQLKVPPNQGRPNQTEAFLDGKEFVWGNGGDRVLFPARMMCAGFALALGLLIYLWAEEMFGFVAGIFALAMFVFDPNVLANGAMVTTDVGAAFCFVAAMYSFYRYCRKPGWVRLGVAGVALGLALSAKFTGIFLVPMLVLVVVAEGWMAKDWRVLWRRVGALAVMGVVAWVVVWSFYGFRYKAAPAGIDINPPLAKYLTQMHDQRDARLLRVVAKYKVLPEGYIWGLENTKETEWDDPSYFFGKVYRHGNWEYFPVALLIKSTLALLILVALVPVAWLWRDGKAKTSAGANTGVSPLRRKSAPSVEMTEIGGGAVEVTAGYGDTLRSRAEIGGGAVWLRYGRELVFLLVPVGVYLAISMSSSMDIGARHLLPVWAFLYVLVGGTAMVLLNRDVRWGYVLAGLLCWQVVTSVRVAPAYMAYGNEAWGGPSKVDRYLGDANTDWGQQLKAVKAYLDERKITNCWFAYFPDGSIDPQDYGIHCKRLPTTDLLYWLGVPVTTPPVISGTVLISAGDLEGIEFGDGLLNPYDSFRKMKPTAVIQHGVYVYDGTFAVPLAAALVEANDASDLADAGKMEEAVAKARAAVRVAPWSGQVHATLADVLLRDGKKAEALQEYETALGIEETVRPDLRMEDIAGLKARIAELKKAGV